MSDLIRAGLTKMPDFSHVSKSRELVDERGRTMRFPTRQDYLDFLGQTGLIRNEKDLHQRPALVEAVYLDWLRRGQVGCVFAQLLSRRRNRTQLRTVVFEEPSDSQHVTQLASDINSAVQEAVDDPNIEAISILLPSIVDVEILVNLVLALTKLPQWAIEREQSWRGTSTLVGLRRQIADIVWAEILILGPFQFFPATRQGPITSIEVRTSRRGSRRNLLRPSRLAAHLADVLTDRFLKPREHGVRFQKWTPMLRSRILGSQSDERAKARTTLTVPTAIWRELKSRHF